MAANHNTDYLNSFLYRNLQLFIRLYCECNYNLQLLHSKLSDTFLSLESEMVLTRSFDKVILDDKKYNCFIVFYNTCGVLFMTH